jgi:uncharacterized protein YaaR (DUF327 family)
MNWITLKLLQYQLKKANKKLTKQKYYYNIKAYSQMIKSYESAIMFIGVDYGN